MYEMKPYDKLKAEVEAIQQLIVEAKKGEFASEWKEVKGLCKELGLTAGMPKGALHKAGKRIEKASQIYLVGSFRCNFITKYRRFVLQPVRKL